MGRCQQPGSIHLQYPHGCGTLVSSARTDHIALNAAASRLAVAPMHVLVHTLPPPIPCNHCVLCTRTLSCCHLPCRRNPCMCGGLPAWLPWTTLDASEYMPSFNTSTYMLTFNTSTNVVPFNTSTNASTPASDQALLSAVWAHVTAAATGNGSAPHHNSSSSYPQHMLFGGANGTTLLGTAGSVWQTCGSPPAEAACALSSLSLTELTDALPLLKLREGAADDSTRARLASWHAAVAPCSSWINGSTSSTCVSCDDAQPDTGCGGIHPSDGAPTCAWRYVSCRGGRVVGLDMSGKVCNACNTLAVCRQVCMLPVCFTHNKCKQCWHVAVQSGDYPPPNTHAHTHTHTVHVPCNTYNRV